MTLSDHYASNNNVADTTPIADALKSSRSKQWDAQWCKVTSKHAEEHADDTIMAAACILHQICAANDKKYKGQRNKQAPFVGAEIPDIG